MRQDGAYDDDTDTVRREVLEQMGVRLVVILRTMNWRKTLKES